MSFKENFSSHPVVYGLSLILAGFIAGYNVYPHLNHGDKKTMNVLQTKHDCEKIRQLIADKKKEAIEQEHLVRLAAPATIYPPEEIKPDSLYLRRLSDLETIKKNINQLNDKLIQCVAN